MTVVAEFAATLVDEWVRAGIGHAVCAPGSRSAPLTRALLEDGRIALHVRLDERSAAFFALGLALASARPVIVVTTSGTAAAELHPAVLEADLSRVPLICCTADRPPELHHVGAPQTLEQEQLFSGALRFACSPGVPDEAGRATWRSLAARLVAEALSGPAGPGPVHCNLAFREPLVVERGELPPGRREGRPFHEVLRAPGTSAVVSDRFAAELQGARRCLVVVGGGIDPVARAPILRGARRLGAPVVAEVRAWPREPGEDEDVLVAAADQLLRSPRATATLAPEVVVRVGAPPLSKVLSAWLGRLGDATRQILIDPFGQFLDPERRSDLVLGADPASLFADLSVRLPGRNAHADLAWAKSWRTAEHAAQSAIDATLSSQAASEPALARALYAAVPAHSTIFASSSMPVRDLEWFAAPRAGAPRVLANRGANGIDGVTSTLLGVASARSQKPGTVVGLIGDLAFLHDLSALVVGRHERLPALRLIVVDNAGGGIFSFLDYAASMEPERFERGFGTPQRQSPLEVAAALGWAARPLVGTEGLDVLLAEPPESLEVLVFSSERGANLEVHRALERNVAEHVDAALAKG